MENPRVYALRQRAAIFGYNALDWRMLSDETKATYLGLSDPSDLTDEDRKEWPNFKIYAPVFPQPETPTLSNDTVDLDLVYPQIIKGGWLVLSVPSYKELYEITEVTEGARADFGLSGKTTRVTLKGENLEEKYGNEVRTTTAFGQSEELEMAETPITTAVSGGSVTLDQEVEGLAAGRLLAVGGLDATAGEAISEVVTLDRAESDGQRTTLYFATALQHGYQRDSVKINANVARATHGEAKTEILGSGDGSKVFPKYTLKQTPLTYVSAATPSGSQTTLEVRANEILWEEVPSLDGSGPTDRVYITRLSDIGTVTVEFGDGITGARLPTGAENITANYRVGTGLDGLVDADQISLLMTRPLGLTAVTNPVASSGAADAEVLDEARQNAPLTVLTMERIVSLKDFEDFTRAFAGIGKAQATLLWNGERQMVHITVAGADGAGINPASELYQNLGAAIDSARHADQAIQVDSYQPLSFNLAAKVLVDEQYVATDVIVSAVVELEEAFSFERRGFGQAVMKSEVLAVMQGVEGVIAVDLDALYLDGETFALNTALPARRAYWDQGVIEPAELLTVHPEGIVLTEMT
jgi:predicted phage baseplate assembly protein